MNWLLNDKGRMFGNRINIIDLLVVAFLIGLTPVFYYAWKIAKKDYPQNWRIEYNNLKAEYRKLDNECSEEIASQDAQWRIEYSNLNYKINKFFNKFPRARKYFK